MPLQSSVRSATLADVLERVLDKGVVIAGDITVKLVDIELLTIQIRLIVASLERAQELGIDWWTAAPYLRSAGSSAGELQQMKERLEKLESQAPEVPGSTGAAGANAPRNAPPPDDRRAHPA